MAFRRAAFERYGGFRSDLGAGSDGALGEDTEFGTRLLRAGERLAYAPDAVVYHHPGWLCALEEEYGRRCISLACEDAEGRLRGVLPVMATSGLPGNLGGHRAGRRLSSLPRTPVAGPLTIDATATEILIKAAVERIRGEIISVWGTQIAEEDQGVLLGQSPESWRPVAERQKEVYEAGLKLLKPGTPCASGIPLSCGGRPIRTGLPSAAWA